MSYNTNDLKSEFLTVINNANNDSIEVIYNIINEFINSVAEKYTDEISPQLNIFLLNPIIIYCLRNQFKNGNWNIAEEILTLIFIQPTSVDFTPYDVAISCCNGRISGNNWKIREVVSCELYGIISLLVNICSQHINIDISADTQADTPVDEQADRYINTHINTHIDIPNNEILTDIPNNEILTDISGSNISKCTEYGLKILPLDVFKYIKTTWLERNRHNVSFIKNN